MNRFSKLYRVMVQAPPEYRLDIESLNNIFVRNEAAIYAAVGVLGFVMACVFATFYAVATKAVPERANEVAGLMILAIAAGAVSGPVCGAVIRVTGNPHAGMIFVTVCLAYMLWAAIRLGRDKNEK